MEIVREALSKMKHLEKEKDELHLCELIFMEDIIARIDKKQEDSTASKGNAMARELFHRIVKEHGSN